MQTASVNLLDANNIGKQTMKKFFKNHKILHSKDPCGVDTNTRFESISQNNIVNTCVFQ